MDEKVYDVLIAGGGFAGRACYRALSHLSTVIVDSKEFFEFNPGLHKALTQGADYKYQVYKHPDYVTVGLVKRMVGKLYHGAWPFLHLLTQVTWKNNKLKLESGRPRKFCHIFQALAVFTSGC